MYGSTIQDELHMRLKQTTKRRQREKLLIGGLFGYRVSAELFNRMAIEIMKAVNFYNYNNRERSLRRIYLCGGGVAVDQIRAAICRVTDLDVHNAEELLPQHDALEAAWLYIKAIGCALQK